MITRGLASPNLVTRGMGVWQTVVQWFDKLTLTLYVKKTIDFILRT
jgi:hypothetical protein